MLSKEDMDKLSKDSMTREEQRLYLSFVIWFLTAVLAGLTVWSINGTFVHDYETYFVKPGVQGFLGFLTMAFFLLSISMLMSVHADKHN